MDEVFKALADPTRRSLLDALREDDGQTLTSLEEGLPMTRFGVMKHLRVLEGAGLSRPGAGAARSSTSSTPSRSGSSTTDG
jgi:DNA-binding transcriptional ArsR family regulator